MESWRTVWREGFAKALSRNALAALRTAIIRNDERLHQGMTTNPPPLPGSEDWPCEGGCAVAFSGFAGEGKETIGEAETFFAETCFKADQYLGEPAACRWFLNWFDDTPRDEMRRELLAEVELALSN